MNFAPEPNSHPLFAAGPADSVQAQPSRDEQAAPLIDAHIHLDAYDHAQQRDMLSGLPAAGIAGVITVSMHLESARSNLRLARQSPSLVYPAFGYHPEQPVPAPSDVDELLGWMRRHADDMVAVGEVGLPYYTRKEAEEAGRPFDGKPYEELLERFIAFAKEHDKPVVLHAVYEDADAACRLLERYGVKRAHFHWFKGSPATVRRMAENGYYVSFTPDIVYEPEIRELARVYPPGQVMSETDGPWPFEGPFEGQMTHPRMTAAVAEEWSRLQGFSLQEARQRLYSNARRFYGI